MNCTGKRIAFTGIAKNYERNTIHRAISDAGGIITNTVTATTDLLILGELPGTGTGKLDAALKNNVPTVSAVDFMQSVTSGDEPWTFGATRAVKSKPKLTKVPKAVNQAFTLLSKTEVMAGFVGF